MTTSPRQDAILAGLFTLVLSSWSVAMPVINEIHYHPDDVPQLGPVPLEFIELHNPDPSPVDLSGWKLADAVSYTFPNGTQLAPGGYLVIAMDPAAVLAIYGTPALGPWSGKLSNSGETIELQDASGVVRDEVSYKPGFPWPTAADGDGPSMELINPSLDNDLGGSWRSSGTRPGSGPTLVAQSDFGWKYAKGTAEASSPSAAWRSDSFDDSSWPAGQTPIGYGTTVSCNTTLADMRGYGAGNYSTVYARKSFELAAGDIPDTLTLRVRSDDGCIVWINGTEVYRVRMPAGQVAYNGLATGSVGTAAWTSVSLSSTSGFLHAGTNVLAIHGANLTQGGSGDFNIDAGLTRSSQGSEPTPGAVNTSLLAPEFVAPQIRKVAHSPNEPAAGQEVAITARITDPDGVGPVSLLYQTVDPGSYIRRTDAAYETNWTTIPMTDDGTAGDETSGDDTFTAVLPAGIQTHRRLVRYRIRFADSIGNEQTVPYQDDEQPNFAYFVYNGVPAWTGAFRPTSHNSRPATAALTYPAGMLESLPPYQLIANATDVANSQYSGSYNDLEFPGTMVYNGVVYDHIQFKNRGQASTYVSGKNKWKIKFNNARDLVPLDNWGRPYAESWNELPLNANASPWIPANRGAAGIEEAAATRALELAGNSAFRSHYVHLRVIDGAAESTPGDQFTGDLWGLYLAIEPTEGNFLDERGMEDGSIYSIEGGNGDKEHQGDGLPADDSDWNSFHNALKQGGQTEAWYRANMDLEKLYTFLAMNRLIGNVDVRPGDNYRYIHRSSDNRWEIVGYDFDMGFVPAHHWGGTMDGVVVAGQPDSILAIMRHPALAREYRNRCREILDLLASDGSPNGGQIGQLLSEYAAMVAPPGQPLNWANLDAAMWNLNPRTTSSHKGAFFLASMTDSRGGLGGTVKTDSWLRTLSDPDGDGVADFAARTQWFIDFSTNTYPSGAAPWVRKATNTAGGGTDTDPNRQKGYGYKYLEWESLYGGYANSKVEPSFAPYTDFPAPPVVTTGNPAYPVNDLRFTTSAFADPQGAGTFSAWQWRIAEISAPGIPGHSSSEPDKYEIETLANSGEITTAPAAFSIPLGIAEAGKTYRVRTRQKDSSGNWSHWSAPVLFIAAEATVADLIHYWNFNDTDNLLTATQTAGGGAIQITGESTSATGQDFSGQNAVGGDPAGAHLRMNNPIGSVLDLSLPTTGYQDIVVRYETRRSGSGAGTQTVQYTLDGTLYQEFTSYEVVDDDPEIRALDFRAIAGVANNPDFALRITFQQGDGGTAGNNRFDNLTVEGSALPPSFANWRSASFPNPADLSDPAVSGPDANPSGDGVTNLMRYAVGVGPHDPAVILLPRLETTPGSHRFLFRYDAAKSDLVWRVKASADMEDWSGKLFDSSTDAIPPLEDGWLPVEVPASADPKMFLRLEVGLLAP